MSAEASPHKQDERFMRLALEEAKSAAAHGDVPVGAVIADRDGNILSRGHNRREVDSDPTGHAEMIALRRAAQALKRWRLDTLTIYVTLEPCPMCAGALLNARIERIVYGCLDPKAGAVDSLFTLGRDPRLNHRLQVTRGVLSDACSSLLKQFFEARR